MPAVLLDPKNVAFDEVLYPGLVEEELAIDLEELHDEELKVRCSCCTQARARYTDQQRTPVFKSLSSTYAYGHASLPYPLGHALP